MSKIIISKIKFRNIDQIFQFCYQKNEMLVVMFICGSGSSVGIVTDYGLDGPGSNPGGDEIFRQSRPALGPNQPPVQWVPRLSRG